jgi:hypothetical protein
MSIAVNTPLKLVQASYLLEADFDFAHSSVFFPLPIGVLLLAGEMAFVLQMPQRSMWQV